jgi:uncharacterized protein YjbI with pentapeptide repeats
MAGCSLQNVRIFKASMLRARIRSADFTGALLEEVDLSEADAPDPGQLLSGPLGPGPAPG